MRTTPFLLALAALLVAAATPARAQFNTPSGLAPSSTAAPLALSRTWQQPIADRAQSPWPYVGTGAVVGGIATIVGLVLYDDQSNNESLMPPIALAPVVLGGAAIGAGAGYLIYRIQL